MSEWIVLAPGAEVNGMAIMLSDLVRQNLEASRTRASIFQAIESVVLLDIGDIDLQVTMDFEKGRLTLYGGRVKEPGITIRSDSAHVLELPNIGVRYGLPNAFDETGREIIEFFKQKRIHIDCSLAHIVDLVRFTRVLSINE